MLKRLGYFKEEPEIKLCIYPLDRSYKPQKLSLGFQSPISISADETFIALNLRTAALVIKVNSKGKFMNWSTDCIMTSPFYKLAYDQSTRQIQVIDSPYAKLRYLG